ncbi:MAG: EAL domain-containing protein [Butyrivibrio sp.]|nr:EAL domain-containing protein [Butyrivibrio sp.]
MATGTYDTISRIFDTFAITSKSRYVFVYDIDKNVAKWSLNAVEYFGFTGEYLNNANIIWEAHIHPVDKDGYKDYMRKAFSGQKVPDTFSYRARNKNDEFVALTCRGVVIKDYSGKPAMFACTIINHGVVDNADPTTFLQNQYQLLNNLRTSKLEKKSYKLILVNFIDFGEINRRYGYTFGNKILYMLATQIRKEIGAEGIAYRGEGTIIAIYTEAMSLDDIKMFYNRLRVYGRENMMVDGNKINAELAAGVIVADDHTVDEHSIYTSAKYALNFSRTQKHGNLIIFHNDELDNNKHSIELVDAVRKSVLNNFEGFYLEYQPIVSAGEGTLRGMEVLLRWKKEPFGVVAPSEFVPWLEHDQVFYSLGNWILKQALNDGKIIKQDHPRFYVNVNLAFIQLERSDFRTTLVDMLQSTGFPATSLCLELSTNSKQMNADHLKSQVSFLKSCGIKVAMEVENFAALDITRALSVDIIRMAPEFAIGLDKNVTNRYMLQAITGFAQNMKVDVCITGVEDEDAVSSVKMFPISELQGYYYGKPVTLSEFKLLPVYNK